MFILCMQIWTCSRCRSAAGAAARAAAAARARRWARARRRWRRTTRRLSSTRLASADTTRRDRDAPPLSASTPLEMSAGMTELQTPHNNVKFEKYVDDVVILFFYTSLYVYYSVYCLSLLLFKYN